MLQLINGIYAQKNHPNYGWLAIFIIVCLTYQLPQLQMVQSRRIDQD